MSTRYLIVADTLEALNPVFDLGVCLSRVLLGRGIHVDYLDLLSHDASLPSERYLETLPVRQVLDAPTEGDEFWKLGPLRSAVASEYHVILQRKDPPVDDLFRAYCRHFEAAPERIVQIGEVDPTMEDERGTMASRALFLAWREDGGERSALVYAALCAGIGCATRYLGANVAVALVVLLRLHSSVAVNVTVTDPVAPQPSDRSPSS